MDDLSKALLPIVESAVNKSLEKADFEAVITAKINEVVGNIPHKKVEVIDPAGISRKLDLVHCSFEEMLINVSTGVPVLLKGEAGTGKSHGAEMVAEALGLEFYALSVGEQTPESKLLGFIDANGNYRTTDFRRCFENGGVFLLDEADAGNPNVLLSMNTALSNGYVSFPDGRVKMHKNFRCIATANTFGYGSNARYVGRNKLDAATIDRFIPMVWELDEQLEKLLCNNSEWLTIVRRCRKIAVANFDNVQFGQRKSIFGAKMLAAGQPLEKVFESLILAGLSEDERELLKAALPKKPVSASKSVKKSVSASKSASKSVSASKKEDDLDELFNY